MSYPTNMIFLTAATAVLVGVVCWLFVRAAVRRLELLQIRHWNLGASLFLAGVFALTLSFALTGRYSQDAASQGIFVAIPLMLMIGVNLLLLQTSAIYRQIVDSIPVHWLIGLHLLRIIPGVVFVALEDTNLLPTDAALQAGYGDIVAGAAALGVAFMVYNRLPYARLITLLWGIFGLLDLLNALYMGLTTFPDWLTMLASQGQDISFINLFLLLPTFSVPLFIVTHVLIFRYLFTRNTEPPALSRTYTSSVT